MKKVIFGILIFLILVLVGCLNENNEIKSKTINLELAEFVAKDYLPKYYPGDYEVLDHIDMYDLEGKLAAYAFIFKKSGFKLDSLEEMKLLVEETESVPEKYFTEETATVVVSAINTESPLMRCYRGLPQIFVAESDIENFIKEEYSEYNKERIIFLNPLDIAYEVSKPNDMDKKPLSDDSLLISSGKKEPRKVFDLRQDIERKQKLEEEQLDQMDRETRKEFLEMEKNRLQSRINKWKEFEERFYGR